MTDKEQILNNFARDINVPHKEQMIIDNSNIIDVTKCKYYNNGWCELPESRDDVRNKPCGDMTLFDCYFKELARKTQECEELRKKEFISNPVEAYENVVKQLARKTHEYEELKSESFTREELITLQEKDIDRYREALEEIGGYCNKEREKWCTEHCVRSAGFCIERNCYPIRDLTYILDIINKAKGDNNENT